jgi:monoamine oxidase
LPVRLSTAAARISSWGRGAVDIETSRGWLRGRAAIVTASTNVLAAEKIRFEPPLPKRQIEAAAKLSLGSAERVALELDGNPLGLDKDDLVFEKAAGARTAGLLANISGTSLCTVDVGGRFGRNLATQGEAAMVAFATDWLAGLFGNDVRKAVKRTHATHWAKEPWVLGGSSAAPPGGQALRRAFAEPFRDRIFFAGEATHETLWGTVGGAWESGERVADAALKRVGGARRR